MLIVIYITKSRPTGPLRQRYWPGSQSTARLSFIDRFSLLYYSGMLLWYQKHQLRNG